MCNFLDPGLLDSLLDVADLELICNVLLGHITEAIDKIAPYKTIQPRARYAPCLSATTKDEMNSRNSLRLKATQSGEEQDKKEYKTSKNATLKSQRKDKRAWAKKQLGEQGKSKDT